MRGIPGARRKAGPASLALGVLGCALLALSPPSRSADPVGLSYRAVKVPGAGSGHLLTIDLEHAEVRVLDSRDHGGGVLTAKEFAEKSGATAVINGSFFDVDGSPMGLLVVDGAERIPLRKVDWGVFAIDSKGARIVHTRDWKSAPGVRQAIQSGPRLVVDGRPLSLKQQSARRTALCTRADGKLQMLVVGQSTEAGALARFLAAEGCADALNLDGGPSTQLYVRDGRRVIEEPGGYGVPIAIGVFPTGATELGGASGCGRH